MQTAVILILTFVAVFMTVVTIYLAITAAQESPKAILRRRLRRMANNPHGSMPDELRLEIIKETPPVERLLATLPGVRNLDKLLDHAGMKVTPDRFLFGSIALVVATLAVGIMLHRGLLLALLLAAIAAVAPYIVVFAKKQQRLDLFTEQMPDALTMMARSLRAGHSLTGAIELIGTEMPAPLGELFKTAYDQQKLGLRMVEAMQGLNDRIDSLDLRFLTTTLSINSEVGGNLAEVLDKLAETIRERLKIRRQVRVYTAQGRLSGYVLAVLPIVAFILFNIMMPGYETVLIVERKGNILLGCAAIMQITGFLIIRKIINIRI